MHKQKCLPMENSGSQNKLWILKIVNAKTNSIKTCKCPIASINIGSGEKSDIQISLPFIELDHLVIDFEEEKISVVGSGILPNTILSYSKDCIIRICNVFIGVQPFSESYADQQYQDAMVKTINVYRESRNKLGMENKSNEISIKDIIPDLINKIITVINPDETTNSYERSIVQMDKNDANSGIVGLDRIKGLDNSLYSETDNDLIEKKGDKNGDVMSNIDEAKKNEEGRKAVNNQRMDQHGEIIANNREIYRNMDGDKYGSSKPEDGQIAYDDKSPGYLFSNKNGALLKDDKRSEEMIGALDDLYRKELGDFSSIPPLGNTPMYYNGYPNSRSPSHNETSPPRQVISETKKEFEETYHSKPSNSILEAAIETKIEEVKDEAINALEGDIDIPFIKQPANDLGIIAIENEILNDAIDEIKSCTPAEGEKKAELLEAQINSFDQLRNTITDTIKEDMRESIKEIVKDEVEIKLKDLNNNVQNSIEELMESKGRTDELGKVDDFMEKRDTEDDEKKMAKKIKIDDSETKDVKTEEDSSKTSKKAASKAKKAGKLKKADALNEKVEKEEEKKDKTGENAADDPSIKKKAPTKKSTEKPQKGDAEPAKKGRAAAKPKKEADSSSKKNVPAEKEPKEKASGRKKKA